MVNVKVKVVPMSAYQWAGAGVGGRANVHPLVLLHVVMGLYDIKVEVRMLVSVKWK